VMGESGGDCRDKLMRSATCNEDDAGGQERVSIDENE